jgi:hypothetical protein
MPFSELSKRLMGRDEPELVALGYWMRKLKPIEGLYRPVGTVFHIPPANVPTLWAYPLVLSLMAGNRNIVRLPKSCPVVDVLEREFGELEGVTLVRYGHEQEITDEHSSKCDMRIIWGSAETIAAIRRSPLPAHAKEIAFPERFSMSTIHAPSYLALDRGGREALAERFSRDLYTYDQAACSSPRLLVWCGEGGHEAATTFYPLLQGYAPDTGQVLAKGAFAYRAIIDKPVSHYRRYGNALTVLRLGSLDSLCREHCGGGLLYEYLADDLSELQVQRQDQTLTTYGFDEDQLRAWARTAGGIDRIVPIGAALSFSRIWDGYDLLHEFTRRVEVTA